MPRPALIVAAVLVATFSALWLAGREQNLRLVLIPVQGTDSRWLATVRSGLQVAYPEGLSIQAAEWPVKLDGLPHAEGTAGPSYPPMAILSRVPRLPHDPLVAIICDVDLAGGPDAQTPWIHGTALSDGRMIVSVRRVRLEHESPAEVQRRVAFLAAHEFGHVLGFRHRRDGSLMGWIRPGIDAMAGTPGPADSDPGDRERGRELRWNVDDPSPMPQRTFRVPRNTWADHPRFQWSLGDRFELPLRRLLRGRLSPGEGSWLPWLLLPMVALPGAAGLLLVWETMRRTFGSARMRGADLTRALALQLALVAVAHYGWSVWGPLLALLCALGRRLVPSPGGVGIAAAAWAGGAVLGLVGVLVDLGYASTGTTVLPSMIDPGAWSAVPGGALAVQAVRATWSRPVEGRASWGDSFGPLAAAAAGAVLAGGISTPSTMLGGAAAGFALVRIYAIPRLQIDLPSSPVPR